MGDFVIPQEPKLNLKMRRLETTDRAHAELFNGLFLQLLTNLAALDAGKDRILIGPEDTPMENNTTLFVVEGMPKPARFEGAAYSNLVFGEQEPGEGTGGLWAREEGGNRLRASPVDGSQGGAVTEGKLSVSEQADPDADFFAKL